VQSREITLGDGAVLVPIVLVILFLALYPQLALHRSEGSVKQAVFPAQALAANPHAQFHYFAGTASASAPGEAQAPAPQTETGSGTQPVPVETE
jgi:hypothetical protein